MPENEGIGKNPDKVNTADTTNTTDSAPQAEDAPTTTSGKKDKGKGKATDTEGSLKSNATVELSSNAAQALMEMNPALKGELAGLDKDKAADIMRKMDISELLTGLAMNSKNQKDMASYKFWQTQPVIRFDDKGEIVDGPIKDIDIDRVPKTPDALLEGFEWVTLDLTDEKELQELYELLSDHYVEDGSALFRFNYSKDFLNW